MQGVKGTSKAMYKQKATMCLQKKKQLEQQMKNIMNQQMMIDQAKFAK